MGSFIDIIRPIRPIRPIGPIPPVIPHYPLDRPSPSVVIFISSVLEDHRLVAQG